MQAIILTAVWSYFLGSIPFGYILVRMFRGEDVRLTGSGNIGATNVARSSPVLGIITLTLDALKGFAAVILTRLIFPGQTLLFVTAAAFAILGHIFSIWLKFRGGKGVATGLGSFAILSPKGILVMIGVFALITLVSRRVSLGSMIAVALLPVLAGALDGYSKMPLALTLMASSSLLIIAKHHQNIRRLAARTEPPLFGEKK